MKYLIVPDVHGRSFWKTSVYNFLKDDDVKIIFLGDYLDPYPDEWKTDDYQTIAIDTFKEILKLKRDNPSKIILLQGNHDMEYSISTRICDCRRDRERYDYIKQIFVENHQLFQLCYETKINDKRFIFSHAGINMTTIDIYDFKGVTDDNVVDYLNNAFSLMLDGEFPDEYTLAMYLGACSYYRGGYDMSSSCVWADLREFIYDKPKQIGYQIFGHTRAYKPIVTEEFAMLDCSNCFMLNDEGKLINIEGHEVPIMDIEKMREN